MTILGCCHHSVHTVVHAIRRVDQDADITTVACPSDDLVPARVVVIVGMQNVRRLQPALRGIRTTLVVVDAQESLRSLPGVEILDAIPTDVGWNPRPIRLGVLARHIRGSAAPLAQIHLRRHSAVDDIVEEAKSHGVLRHVMAHTQKLSGAAEREAIYNCAVRYLSGEITEATLRRRTSPDREALRATHEAMCDALAGSHGLALIGGLRLAREGVDPVDAALRTGADVFEIRFIRSRTHAAT